MAQNNNNETDDEGRITFILDPELKRKFKAFCALKDVTQKDCLTAYVEKCVETIKPKR